MAEGKWEVREQRQLVHMVSLWIGSTPSVAPGLVAAASWKLGRQVPGSCLRAVKPESLGRASDLI